MSQTFELIVGIDFGTTRSSVALLQNTLHNADRGRKRRAPLNGSFVQSILPKETTALVTNREGSEVMAVGDPAVLMAARERTNDDVVLFEQFKMGLYEEGNKLDWAKTMCRSRNRPDAQLPLSRVITLYLSRIKEGIVASMKNVDVLANSLIVLTVPAIWTDTMKAFMRRAAHEAGLIADYNSSQLLFGLEPECAAMDCIHVLRTQQGTETFSEDSIAMILDCGGGTLDISTLRLKQISPTMKFEHALKVAGGPWGGRLVDEEMEKWLKGFLLCLPPSVKESDVDDFLQSEDYVQFHLRSWLLAKNNFSVVDDEPGSGKIHARLAKMGAIGLPGPLSPTKKQQNVSVDFSAALDFFDEKLETEISLQDAVSRWKALNPAKKDLLEANDDCVLIFGWSGGDNLVKYWFDKVVSEIIHFLENMWRSEPLLTSEPITLCLVGGLGANKYLASAIEKFANSRRAELISPEEPAESIVRGACLFGMSPTVIAQRIARYHYGVKVRLPWEDSFDAKHKTWSESEKEFFAPIGFSEMVKMGQNLPNGHKETRDFVASLSYQVRIEVFTCSQEVLHSNPLIIHEGMESVGGFSVDCCPRGRVTVNLVFGDTELKAEASTYDNENSFISSASVAISMC